MIGALSGTVASLRDEVLLIDVNGVGYEVLATRSVLETVKQLGDKIRVIIFTDVKENSISLFGFSDALEREVFFLLKKVKGIGSKLALSIISALGSENLLQAVGMGDISRLKSIPGIGSKTAERVILELRESVQEFANQTVATAFTQVQSSVAAASGVQEDVVLALEKLGFSNDRARQILSKTLEVHKAKADILKSDPGELLRLSLGQIG